MQDPNEDTEWNDILRSKGIIPPKAEKEITEEDVVQMVENTIQQKTQGKALEDMTLEELDSEEDGIDEEEERLFQEYRRRRMEELKEAQKRARFGDVMEISKADYVREVNEAGEGVWVVLHIYKQGIPLCSLINQYLTNLAHKFPETKFLRSISSVCIPNYSDSNLPTILIYFENDLKKQLIGPHVFGGMNLKQDELEWILAQAGAVKTELEGPPKPEIDDFLNRSIRQSAINMVDDDDD